MKPDQTVIRKNLIMVYAICNIYYQIISADEKADDIVLEVGKWLELKPYRYVQTVMVVV